MDARKGLKMFEKVEVRVLGVVENMSMHTCAVGGHVEHVFGKAVARGWQRSTAVVGVTSLDIRIREDADALRRWLPSPAVHAPAYFLMARRTAARWRP